MNDIHIKVFETANIYHCKLERWNSALAAKRLNFPWSGSDVCD